MGIVVGLFILLAGAGSGLALLEATRYMIQKRIGIAAGHWLINGNRARMIWAVLAGGVYWSICFFVGINLEAAKILYVFSFILVLSAVDIIIRRIPNEILLALIIGAVGFMLLDHSLFSLRNHLFGLAAGIGIFFAPFLLGKQAGAGDLKYAAAIGFFLGFYYTIIAFVIMSAFYFCFAAALLLSKKGNLKTKTALGPYMSLGFLGALVMMLV